MSIFIILCFILSIIFGWLISYLLFPSKKIMITVDKNNYKNNTFVDDNGVCYKYQLNEYNSSS